MNTSLYHPKWTLIRRLIRKRASDTCEHCGIPQGTWQVKVVSVGPWGLESLFPHYPTSKPHYLRYRVWLAVAHLDQDRDNNAFDNLALLCPRCHFQHDRKANLMRRKYGREYKKAQTRLELEFIQ